MMATTRHSEAGHQKTHFHPIEKVRESKFKGFQVWGFPLRLLILLKSGSLQNQYRGFDSRPVLHAVPKPLLLAARLWPDLRFGLDRGGALITERDSALRRIKSPLPELDLRLLSDATGSPGPLCLLGSQIPRCSSPGAVAYLSCMVQLETNSQVRYPLIQHHGRISFGRGKLSQSFSQQRISPKCRQRKVRFGSPVQKSLSIRS
jgi:hypothetical protein